MSLAIKRHVCKKLTARIVDTRGQATVEAAFAIPVLMLLILLLIQPAIILYDTTVMQNAVNEGARFLVTSSDSGMDGAGVKSAHELADDFIRRRLGAIPQADLFHVHGTNCSYVIELSGDETQKSVSVTLQNEVMPLPLLGFVAGALGMTNANGNFVISVQAIYETQPEWILKNYDSLNPGDWTKGG